MSWGWYPDPYFFLNKLFSSEETTAIGNGEGYVNDYVDEMLSKAFVVTDIEERAEYYAKATEQIMKDYSGVYYANPYEMYGINSRVVDFTPRADSMLTFVVSEDGETISRNTSVAD